MPRKACCQLSPWISKVCWIYDMLRKICHHHRYVQCWPIYSISEIANFLQIFVYSKVCNICMNNMRRLNYFFHPYRTYYTCARSLAWCCQQSGWFPHFFKPITDGNAVCHQLFSLNFALAQATAALQFASYVRIYWAQIGGRYDEYLSYFLVWEVIRLNKKNRE